MNEARLVPTRYTRRGWRTASHALGIATAVIAMTAVVTPYGRLGLPILSMTNLQIAVWITLVASGVIVTTLCWARAHRPQPPPGNVFEVRDFSKGEVLLLVFVFIVYMIIIL